MPGEEDRDEGEAEEEAPETLPEPPQGTLTTPGGILFAPFLESRLGNLLPGCTPTTGDELQYMVESKSMELHATYVWLVVGGACNYTLCANCQCRAYLSFLTKHIDHMTTLPHFHPSPPTLSYRYHLFRHHLTARHHLLAL